MGEQQVPAETVHPGSVPGSADRPAGTAPDGGTGTADPHAAAPASTGTDPGDEGSGNRAGIDAAVPAVARADAGIARARVSVASVAAPPPGDERPTA
ncbi:hypothetical protein DKL51_31960, partial [Micromonospora globispora]